MEPAADPPTAEIVAVEQRLVAERSLPEPVVEEAVQEVTTSTELLERFDVPEAELVARLQDEAEQTHTDEVAQQPMVRIEAATIQAEVEEQINQQPEVSAMPYDELETKLAGEVVELPNAVNTAAAPVEHWPVEEEPAVPAPIMLHADTTAELEERPIQPVEMMKPEVWWEERLYREPVELQTELVQVLAQYGEQRQPAEDGEIDDSEQREAQPAPRIVTAIAERLKELDEVETEVAARALQEVIGALHGVQLLESRDADPVIIATVEEQLTELCAVWLESLDVEYTERDIKAIVLMLRDPQLVAEAITNELVEAKDLGTHEMKYFARMASSGADIEQNVHSVLGTFALNALGIQNQTGKTAV